MRLQAGTYILIAALLIAVVMLALNAGIDHATAHLHSIGTP